MLPMRDLSRLPAKPVLPFAWSRFGLQVGTAEAVTSLRRSGEWMKS
jgi:hypothetical protein